MIMLHEIIISESRYRCTMLVNGSPMVNGLCSMWYIESLADKIPFYRTSMHEKETELIDCWINDVAKRYDWEIGDVVRLIVCKHSTITIRTAILGYTHD